MSTRPVFLGFGDAIHVKGEGYVCWTIHTGIVIIGLQRKDHLTKRVVNSKHRTEFLNWYAWYANFDAPDKVKQKFYHEWFNDHRLTYTLSE